MLMFGFTSFIVLKSQANALNAVRELQSHTSLAKEDEIFVVFKHYFQRKDKENRPVNDGGNTHHQIKIKKVQKKLAKRMSKDLV